ncbi:hypothetical protein A2264_01905 [candidate division WWE3 bacterium RIFOXYA2_FULL_46_9]|uniref:Type IV secretion system coupling protein TraD DNA-binding domain-containing protein n=1 Tax=candidate division WWE3 bacterium RIFOXYA2_FULL_46_9 TaxID=1802636 RepID=A0A1F4W1S9_UNCKA|nr:MAG: hypothetical protein A2264_01905 [candidate division WWE3 bacterium RIFOXYA2_FULL_46_9]
MLTEHVFMSGKTGQGKSKLLELVEMQLALQGRGFALIDPEGQTADDSMGRFAEFQKYLSPFQKMELYYLKVSTDMAWSYDPGESDLTGKQYDAWLARKVGSLSRAIARRQLIGAADAKQQMRRFRVLPEVICMSLVRGRDGKHFGLHRSLECLQDMGSDRFERKFNMVCEQMPRHQAWDLWRLHHLNVRSRWDEIESAYNALWQFLDGPIVPQMLSGKAPSINFRRGVERGAIYLANVSETDGFSQGQGYTLAAILYEEIITACWLTNRPYYLIGEEAESVLGEDLGGVFARGRKHGCRLILCVQHLGALKNKYMDIMDKAMSQPGVIITFQQKTDLEEWGELLGTPNLDLRMNWIPMDRPDGQEWMQVPEVSVSEGERFEWSRGDDVSVGNGQGENEGEDESEEEGTSFGTDRKLARGKTKGRGQTEREQHSNAHGSSSPAGGTVLDNKGRKMTTSNSVDSAGSDVSSTEQDSLVKTDGESSSVSFRKGKRKSRGNNWQNTITHGQKVSESGGTSNQRSLTIRNIPLPRHKTEYYPHGLKTPLEAQDAKMKMDVRTLGKREIALSAGNLPTVFCKVQYLPEAFAGRPAWGKCEIKHFIDEMCKKPCFFVPAECEKWVRRLPSPKPSNGSSNGSTILSRWTRFGFIQRMPPTNGSQNSNGKK